MASSALAIPTSYHKPTPSIRKSKLDTTKATSEDELLKFFLHGSYDVQRGNIPSSPIKENADEIECNKDEIKSILNINNDDKNGKSRCMFEETYMINISVKQPDKTPSSKQIDVRIEKTPSDIQNLDEKIDDDEISSIFDEDDNDDIDSVIFNEINSSTIDTPSTKLTLADMINKTLTKMPTLSSDKITQNNNWFIEEQDELKKSKLNENISSSKPIETVIQTTSPKSKPPILTSNIVEDEKLFKYLDYLETKDETNQPIKSSNISTTINQKKSIPSKQEEQIPIIDLEQLCRSLTVQDLKDELIRKKIYELKILIDEQHIKQKSSIPLIKPRKDTIPILIAMPPIVQQRRRTTIIQPSTLIQSKTHDFQTSYNQNYHEIFSNYSNKKSPPSLSSSNKQQYTRNQIPSKNINHNY